MLLPKRKQCTKCGRKLPATTEFFSKAKTVKWGLRSYCKQCQSEYNKQWRETHKGEIKQYQEQWRQDNAEYFKEYFKEWFKDNPHIRFNANIKHRHGLNSNITKEQYYEILEYFGYTCAYCGCELDYNNRTLDHIIALSKGGAVDPWCIVPCCGSCNASKKDKNYLSWLYAKEMLDIERLNKIYEWIEYAFDKYNE